LPDSSSTVAFIASLYLRAELEDVADLDAAHDRERAGAVGLGSPATTLRRSAVAARAGRGPS
jgi:hypothetical protein